MIPAISVVGKPNSGKTTLIEILITALRQRGYKIGTIKHSHEDAQMDVRGKDTWRHAMAGAETVVLSSPRKFLFMKNPEKELQLTEILKFVKGVNIIITEGYKGSDKPKIAVIDSIDDLSLIKDPVFALAGKKKILIPKNSRAIKIPFFNFHDPGLVDLIEGKFLKRCRDKKNGRKTCG